MVNDTTNERHNFVGLPHYTTTLEIAPAPALSASASAIAIESKDSELYDQCFAVESPKRDVKLEPKVIFAKVLRQIDSMQLLPRPSTTREAVVARGYVFVINEVDSDFVTIGHGGRNALASTLRTLQLGNPRQLEIVAVLQRASFDDARELCSVITRGMMMYKMRGKQWYTTDNCCNKMSAMFARIDRIEDPVHGPPILRR